MIRLPLSATLPIILVASMVRAEAPKNKPSALRPHPRSFSQAVVGRDGLPVRLAQPIVKNLAPLNFAVDSLDAVKSPTNEQLEVLAKRMQDVQRVVDEAMEPDGKNLPSSERVIKALQDRQKKVGGQLAQDLSNLLVAASVEMDRFKPDHKVLDHTRVWSFRNLADDANWGPVIEMSPNSVQLIPVLNLLYKNELVANTDPDFCIVDPVLTGPDSQLPMNCPNGFDVINLHTHGLNVSPRWPADDIFRQIHPRQLKFFLYQIPSDQPAGTYFYHPHNHGSVSTQVAGGMAGPLIIRDKTQGLDKLGEENGWGSHGESVAMFQQLTLYQTAANNGQRFTRPDFFALKDVDDDHLPFAELCVERPSVQKVAARLRGHALGGKPAIVRPPIETWVSGKFQPILGNPLAYGEIRRLRLIHAGVEENINFTIRCTAPDLPPASIQVIAWDGIPLEQPFFVSDLQPLILSPGNRADVLVCIPSDVAKVVPGQSVYSIMQRDATDPTNDFLAQLIVDSALPVASKPFVSAATGRKIFQACAPKLDPPAALNLEAFNLSFADASLEATGKFTPGTFQINRNAYPGDRKLFRLNHSSGLALAVTDGDGDHPLHIHVNSFLVPADPSRAASGLPPGQFWADTLLLQHAKPAMNVFMPFHHWSGDSVSHCHILDHEDAGMMSLIRIQPDVFCWPEFPLNKIMEMPNFPEAMLQSLKTTRPEVGKPVPASLPDTVSLFFFLPALSAGEPCPHCTKAVKAVAEVRQALAKRSNIRVVVVSAAAPEELPAFDSLGLTKGQDVICSDSNLIAFESVALIDGTPLLEGGKLTFPNSFPPNSRKPKWPSDVMHGLFIVDSSGMVVSARRGFSAFDDTEQIMREVDLAGRGQVEIVDAYAKAISERQSSANGGRETRAEQHKLRFEQRAKTFDATKR